MYGGIKAGITGYNEYRFDTGDHERRQEPGWLCEDKDLSLIHIFMFQSYELFPNLTAFENVAYGLRNQKIRERDITKRVDRLFAIIHLSDAKGRVPAQLSGGEQQRVALARALALEPDFLLLDEPLSALDAKVRQELRRQICSIQKQMKLTTIMVTHDQDEALTMADRIVVMNKANIMQEGTFPLKSASMSARESMATPTFPTSPSDIGSSES